ncbi:class I SAM-dependent methyltransferase [Pantoea sp. A4]|uniref:class I SAM-dependent methyltransferase n=1 Tax=Pantoea sp. A4 TaxID=1225184 RepID=UPI0003804B96|nr:class I SAM-dependent methyltransferase [Pantoea sp. A4]
MSVHQRDFAENNSVTAAEIDISKNIWFPEKYDTLRKQLIPSFDLLYQSAVNTLLMSVNRPDPRIIDLGAGTGLLSFLIKEKLPQARITLADRSEAMLAEAQKRFHGVADIDFVRFDLQQPQLHGEYDVVVSGLAIHHLSHEGKRKLFGEIQAALAPQGVFINVEQVSAPNDVIEKMYDIQHEKHVVDSNTPPAEWQAGRERMKLDICAEVYDQLTWLREAGFSAADCLAKSWRFATYAGWK